MAGATNPTRAPWPKGHDSAVIVELGGLAPNGLNGVLDSFQLPWDCRVGAAYLTATKTSTNAPSFTLVTVDGSKTVVAGATPADTVAVKQSLHADIVGLDLVAGDKISLGANASAGSTAGVIRFRLELIPKH